MADTQIRGLGSSPAPLPYTVPGAQEIILKTLYAEFDGTSAAAAWLPCIRIRAPGGGIVGEFVTADSVAAGGSADTTFSPFRRRVTPSLEFPRNIGQLGMSGAGTLGSTHQHTLQFVDVKAGDGIFVLAMAPSEPSVAAPIGLPQSCTDSKGNTYVSMEDYFFEANPPNVNEGVAVQLFFCQSSLADLVAGSDSITASWSNNVYDRSIMAWQIRHDGGAQFPNYLASTPWHDIPSYTSTKVTLTSPGWTPARDNGVALALLITTTAGANAAWQGVVGYDGYLEITSGAFTGSKSTYRIHQQTYGALAVAINQSGLPEYELDLGQLPGGVPIGSFNGVGQNYPSGANSWKGIVLYSVD